MSSGRLIRWLMILPGSRSDLPSCLLSAQLLPRGAPRRHLWNVGGDSILVPHGLHLAVTRCRVLPHQVLVLALVPHAICLLLLPVSVDCFTTLAAVVDVLPSAGLAS